MIYPNQPVKIGEDAHTGMHLTIRDGMLFLAFPEDERSGYAGEYLRRGRTAAHAGNGEFFEFIAELAFTRRVVADDGRDPDPITGLPMESDAEFRARIKSAAPRQA